MSDALKILREQHAQKQREAQDIERDLLELERITSKYGLTAVPVGAADAAEKVEPARTRNNQPDPNSATTRTRRIAASAIRERGEPMPLNDLFPLVIDQVEIGGKDKKAIVSGYLSHSSDFVNVVGRGWWLKALPLPRAGARQQAAGEREIPNGGDVNAASRVYGGLPLNS